MANGNPSADEKAMTHPAIAPFWEPLVQGRTYELDYSPNYLAVPGSFGPDDLAWARRFESGSRRSAVEAVLRRKVRFCVFKDRGYCGVGVSLPAGLICDDQAKTMDNHRTRENYVFLGGVARCDQELFPESPHHPGVPELGALRLRLPEVFGPLYDDYIVARYHEKPLPGRVLELLAVRSEPRVLFPPDLPVVTSAPPTLSLSRGRDGQVKVWPSTCEAELWAAACLAEPPVSLCLNVAKEEDARASGFDHVTIREGRVEKDLSRREAPRVPSPGPVRPSSAPGSNHPEKKYQFVILGWSVTLERPSKSRRSSESHQGQARERDRGGR
jgi:hypothetical protein